VSSAIFILTSARATERPFEYLADTVRGIDAEELHAPRTIVCDGPYTGPTFGGWTVEEFIKPAGSIKGNKLAYWRLLELGAASGLDVVALEDDLRFCTNAVRRMATFPVPADLTWVQFFSPMVIRNADTWPGLWRPPPFSHLFLQAVKFSRAGVLDVLRWRDDPEFTCYAESDQALNLCAMRGGLRYGVHAPDLVDHVGGVSLASGADTLNKWRTSSQFSHKLDALTLYARDDLYR
jgi:hypothetical protein